MDDYYKRLGLEPSASVDDVKRAYRRRARLYHRQRSIQLVNGLRQMDEAYAVLSHPYLKQRYDALRAEHPHESGRPQASSDPERYLRISKLLRAEARTRARQARRLGNKATADNAPLLHELSREQRRRDLAWARTQRLRRVFDALLRLLLVLALIAAVVLVLRAAS